MRLKLNKNYDVSVVDTSLLGYIGETNSRPVTFEGLETDGADTYSMLIKYDDGAGSTYEVPITNNVMIVTAGILYKSGDVSCQIFAKKFENNAYKFVKKSSIFRLKIGCTLSGTGEIPTPEESQSILDNILAQEQNIVTAVANANTAITATNQAKADAEAATEAANAVAKTASAVVGQVAVVDESTGKTYSVKIRIRDSKPILEYEKV